MKTSYFAGLIALISTPVFAQTLTYTIDPARSELTFNTQWYGGRSSTSSGSPATGSFIADRDLTSHTLEVMSGEINAPDALISNSFMQYPQNVLQADSFTIYNNTLSMSPNGTSGGTVLTTATGQITDIQEAFFETQLFYKYVPTTPPVFRITLGAPTITDVGNIETLTYPSFGVYNVSGGDGIPMLGGFQLFGTLVATADLSSPEPSSLILLMLPAFTLLRRKRN